MDKFRNTYRIETNRLKNWDYSSDGLYFITMNTQHRVCNLGEIINDEVHLSDFGQIVNDEWYKSFEIRDELFLDTFIIMPNHIHAIVGISKINNDNIKIGDGGDRADGDHDGGGRDGGGCVGGGTQVETHGRASLTSDARPQSSDARPQSSDARPQSSNARPQSSNAHPQSSNAHPPSSPGRPQSPNIHPKSNSVLYPINTQHIPFHRLPKSLSSFIAGFKSAVNTTIDDYIDQHQLTIAKYNRNNHFFQPNYHDHIIRDQQSLERIRDYIINNPKNWNNDTVNPHGRADHTDRTDRTDRTDVTDHKD